MNLLYAVIVVGVVFGVIWLGMRALKHKMAAAAGEMSSLLLEGAGVTASITSVEKRRMSRGQFEYYVTYTFQTRDGAEHSKEFRVSATKFDDYREGQAIDIVYLPRDPSVSATREMVDKARNAGQGNPGGMS